MWGVLLLYETRNDSRMSVLLRMLLRSMLSSTTDGIRRALRRQRNPCVVRMPLPVRGCLICGNALVPRYLERIPTDPFAVGVDETFYTVSRTGKRIVVAAPSAEGVEVIWSR